MYNTIPCNPFPISSEQLHKCDNEDLQSQINAINDVIAPEFDAEAGTYEIGDKVMYDGKLYEFTSAHETAGDWNPTEVTDTTVGDELSSLESGLTNVADDVKLNTQDLTTTSRSKNILPITIDILKGFNTQGTWNGNTYTNNGTVYVVSTNSAGYVTKINVSGTPQGSINYFKLNDFIGDGTSYILSGCPYNGQTWSYAMFIDFDSALWDKGDGVTFNNVGTGEISIRVAADYAMPSGGLDYYPMIRPAIITDSTFTPYIPSVNCRLSNVGTKVVSLTGVTTDTIGSAILTNVYDRLYKVIVTYSGAIVFGFIRPTTNGNTVVMCVDNNLQPLTEKEVNIDLYYLV